MFGLKVVKEEDYSLLVYQLNQARELLSKRESEVKTLNSRVSELEAEVLNLLKKVPAKKEENKTILLTDVAETPLNVEKPVRKPRKTVKKTEGTTPRKKVVHKNEEV